MKFAYENKPSDRSRQSKLGRTINILTIVMFVVAFSFVLNKGEVVSKSFAAEDDVLAKYGDQVVTRAQWDLLAKQYTENGASKEQVEKEYENIIRSSIIYPKLIEEDIEEIGIKTSKQYTSLVDEQVKRITNQLYAQYLVNLETIEEDMRKEYDLFIKQPGVRLEFHAKHILVDQISEAQSLLERIKAGEDFSELAREHSIDPGSALKGGDLGFINVNDMVPEFSRALLTLEDGEVIETPVQTQFGHHLILRVATRPAKSVPPFESVQELLQNSIVNKAVNERLEQLVKTSNVEIFKLGN